MAVLNKKFNKSSNVNPCRLIIQDLTKLVEKIKEGLGAVEDQFRFNISANFDNTSVTAESLDDFLKMDDLPDELSELNIIISIEDNVVSLRFGDYVNKLHVS